MARKVTAPVIAFKEDGQPVHLEFDTWTPRSHFIVVQSEPAQEATTNELQATYETICHFLHENSQFDQDAILSFHRGIWYQKHTNKWHAHLCVPKEPYLNLAKIKIIEIPRTKQWDNARTVDEGMNIWHEKQIQEYRKYQTNCVKEGRSSQTLVKNIDLSKYDSLSNEFKLVWMSSTPRIGIVARSPSTSTLESLYTFMSKVRSDLEKDLSQQDEKFSNFGCHLCLYVRGQSGVFVTVRSGSVLAEDGRLNENSNMVGYIQMDEVEYLQLLPHELRQIWLDGFTQSEHFVST